MLSSNAIDAGFKIRPTEEELKTMGPEFNELWNRYFKDKPDKPVMFGSIVAGGVLFSPKRPSILSDHDLLQLMPIIRSSHPATTSPCKNIV